MVWILAEGVSAEGIMSETKFIRSSAVTGVIGSVTMSEGGLSQVRSIGAVRVGGVGVRKRRRCGQESAITV